MKIEDYNKHNCFSTPENYFDRLNKEIVEKSCGKQVPAINRKTIRLVWFKRVSYAAILAIIAFTAIAVIKDKDNSRPTPNVETNKAPQVKQEIIASSYETIDSTIVIDEEFIDNMLTSYPIDDYTFYSFLTDTGF